MSFRHNVTDCLGDILENIADITAYLSDLDRQAFAAERRLERVCTAASRRGNRRRHDDGRISDDVVWKTATEDLPLRDRAVRGALSGRS